MTPVSSRRRGQRGFAMLLVFLMAAVIAITLYMEIPRVSFESQRQKEGLLIERGEQYKRAIKVFVAANKRYPASIEELESFNNHRYLRKRYIDPMTGKSEWRIVHIGPGGVFTDSLINKQKKDGDKDKDGQQTTQTTTGDPNNPGGPSAVPKRRDSEIAGLCGGTMPGQSMPGQTTGQPGQPGQPGLPGMPGMPGMQPGMQPGMTPGMPMPPTMPGQINPATGLPYSTNPCPAGPLPGQPGYTGTGQPYPGQTYPGQQPGQTYPGQQPGQQAGLQPGMPGWTPYSTQPGAGGPNGPTPFQQPGQNPAMPGMTPGGANNAQQLIQNLLTQPRPGGFSGQPMQNSAAGGQTIGGGIAGFASKANDEGIRVYNEHTNYKEWEFIYDYTKDTGVMGQQGANGTPASQMGTAPGQTPATTGGAAGNGAFGAGPAGFNQGPSTFGTPPAPPAPVQQPQQ